MEGGINLTPADLDKVRDIAGFPKGTDDDIITLSKPPNYTAFPNPFVEEFIREHGTPYDEATDDYQREPFTSDVSEGKNDPIYNAHSYHTKVPYKAIMRYILHYTKPGDIVFDGFCGTGMTGVAAQMCGVEDYDLAQAMTESVEFVNWGKRFAVLSDLSPAATFIASVYNSPVDVEQFAADFEKIFNAVKAEFGWMYETKHTDGKTYPINYTVWSDVFICPSCGEEFVFWDVAVDKKTGKVNETFRCPKCQAEMSKTQCTHAVETYYDSILKTEHAINKQVPVMISYRVGKKLLTKTPDAYDFAVLDKVNRLETPDWFPTDRMREGKESRRNDKSGITHVNHFYTRRTLLVLAAFWNSINQNIHDRLLNLTLKATLTGVMLGVSKLQRFRLYSTFPNMILSGTLYIGSTIREWNVLDWVQGKFHSIEKMKRLIKNFKAAIISCQSLTDMRNVPDSSIDYIFTDPPFASNLMYSELNFIWEAWLKVITNNETEAVVNPVQQKDLAEYQSLMTRAFFECFRILKPNRWLTVEFHNSKNAVWNAIQESLMRAGFVIADVRILDKRQGSFKQVTTTSAVKQDLIISAYKPRDSMIEEFYRRAGSSETAWLFVREHLKNLPVVVKVGDKLATVSERQKFLLYDRMVAFHLLKGLSVPIGAAEFYGGLAERFIEQDEMYFLPNQINEYNAARVERNLMQTEESLFILDEKTAIDWIARQLQAARQTYQDLQPNFMQAPRAVKKGEEIPELATLLEENFLRDADERWYVPDPKKIGDVEKLREKNLLREFQGYMSTTGALKVFRSEAVRAGFKDLFAKKNYAAILAMAERLPEDVLFDDVRLSSFVEYSRQQTGESLW